MGTVLVSIDSMSENSRQEFMLFYLWKLRVKKRKKHSEKVSRRHIDIIEGHPKHHEFIKNK